MSFETCRLCEKESMPFKYVEGYICNSCDSNCIIGKHNLYDIGYKNAIRDIMTLFLGLDNSSIINLEHKIRELIRYSRDKNE